MNATHRILNRPIVEWEKAIEGSKSTPHDLEQDLRALIQRAALLSAYISRRYNLQGGSDRATAAKYADDQLVRLRKVMGYSYPDNIPISMAFPPSEA